MPNYGRPYSTEDMANVLFFLRGAERENEMFEGIEASEAFESACNIVQLPPEQTRKHLDKGDTF